MRGQASLEFLATYGWAIMLVMVMVGALAYFGVTNPTDVIPESCTITSGFACRDFQFSASGPWFLRLAIENNLDGPVRITANSFNVTSGASSASGGDCTFEEGTPEALDSSNNWVLGAGEYVRVSCGVDFGFALDTPAKAQYYFEYVAVTGRYTHAVEGTVTAVPLD